MGNILDGAHFHGGGDEGGSDFIGLLLIIVVICAAIADSTCSKKNEYSKNRTTKAFAYEYRTVNYSSEYGQIIYLDSESMAAFLQASTPYCCINKANHYECGKEGEDISSQMGDSSSNTELRFKSSNGKSGSLTIRIRPKVQSELNR